jgi:hypothetical protein
VDSRPQWLEAHQLALIQCRLLTLLVQSLKIWTTSSLPITLCQKPVLMLLRRIDSSQYLYEVAVMCFLYNRDTTVMYIKKYYKSMELRSESMYSGTRQKLTT